MAANRRPRGGHSTGARPAQVDTVTPDEVITDSATPTVPLEVEPVEPVEPEAAPVDATVARTANAAPAAVVPTVLDDARNSVVTATDLAQPKTVARGPAVADRDMYDNGGPRGAMRLVARAGQVIPAWYTAPITG